MSLLSTKTLVEGRTLLHRYASRHDLRALGNIISMTERVFVDASCRHSPQHAYYTGLVQRTSQL